MRRSASPAAQSSTALANLTCLLGIEKLARKLPDPGSGERFDVGFSQKSKSHGRMRSVHARGRRTVTLVRLIGCPEKMPETCTQAEKPQMRVSLYRRVVNRAGLEPATRCCIQKCYVVGSSSISLRLTSRSSTVFATVLFPNLFPDSQQRGCASL
jgi:hypothetical protein